MMKIERTAMKIERAALLQLEIRRCIRIFTGIVTLTPNIMMSKIRIMMSKIKIVTRICLIAEELMQKCHWVSLRNHIISN